MQLLAQIEDNPRGIYTGAIGFFSREQTVFNVAIRTLVLEDGERNHGCGRQALSSIPSPAAEFRECRLKAEFLTRSTEPFSLIETMLWNGGYPLIESPSRSACGFGGLLRFLMRSMPKSDLPCSPKLLCLPTERPRKVRLLLDCRRHGSHRD